MEDHIYIIGSGAVGKVLAVALQRSGKKVTIIRGSIDDQPKYVERINVVLENKTEMEAEIEVDTLSNFATLEGIIVLTNKSYGNKALASALKGKVNDSPLAILQNGLGVEQPFIDNNFPEIYRCVLFVTSQTIGESKLRFKPVSVSPIGIIKGDRVNLNRIVEQLNSPDFKFKAEENIQTIIWKKAIVNCVFNSICPLLEIDNGIFHRDESVLAIAKRVVEECITISSANGIVLDAKEVIESLLLISKSSDGQLISTLQDIRNGRQTEIDTLNFEIARIAQALGLEDVVKETKLLGELTRLKSELNR